MQLKYLVSASVLLLTFAASSRGQSSADAATQHTIIAASDLQWVDAPPVLAHGAKMAVLAGDPTKTGLFTIRLKAPDGYKIAPHTHPTAEMITVVSGNFTLGTGATADGSNSKTLAAGGFVVMPTGMQHYAGFKGETIVQVTSEGPFVINYVNPSDDPSRAK